MSNYTKATNFATKDALTSGNPLKTLSGTELDDEFNAIQTASATKANTASAQLTGVPVAPTAAADTNTTQLATTAFVTTEAALKADLTGAAFTGPITTTSTVDGVDIATRDAILTTTTATADAAATLTAAQTFTAGQRGEITALTDAASIATDLALSNNFSVTLAGNRTLANPTNIVAGQSGSIFITQDATGFRTLAYGSYFKFVGGTAPVLSTVLSSIDRLDYVVRTATSIHAVISLDVK